MIFFEVEYVQDGRLVTREVSDISLAKELAKSLAIASGRRAIVRRKAERERWSVVVVSHGGAVRVLDLELSKREAAAMWRGWDHRKEGTVLLAWPKSVPIPNWLGTGRRAV